jgi:tetratricopeptide (TPR) repeat protein
MGLTKGNKFLTGVPRIRLAAFFFLFSLIPFHGFAQNAVSLTGEISRLERLAQSAPGSRAKYNAFLALARLHRLSGNSEAALAAYGGALAASPGDGRALLEQGQLFISRGENEKAAAAFRAIPAAGDRDLLIRGRYLSALLEAFASNIQALSSLAEDNDFSEYRGGIYYTLWKLTGLSAWKNRLSAEFPQSPEAKIAAAAGVESAPTPLWLLFPGREAPQVASSTPAVSSAPQPLNESAGSFLQAGLFGREENARALADKLRNSGFEPCVIRRQVNGSDYFAVGISGGRDVNAAISRLKDAGYDAFPVAGY